MEQNFALIVHMRKYYKYRTMSILWISLKDEEQNDIIQTVKETLGNL